MVVQSSLQVQAPKAEISHVTPARGWKCLRCIMDIRDGHLKWHHYAPACEQLSQEPPMAQTSICKVGV